MRPQSQANEYTKVTHALIEHRLQVVYWMRFDRSLHSETHRVIIIQCSVHGVEPTEVVIDCHVRDIMKPYNERHNRHNRDNIECRRGHLVCILSASCLTHSK